MNFVEFNEEVLFTSDPITSVTAKDVAFLKERASQNHRKRVRLCAHRDVEDPVHEMLIVHTKGTYVRPHKHLNKIESFHIIEGRLKVVTFDDAGGITDVFSMGDYSSGETFFQRASEGCFHTVIPVSELVVFHETTNGPFRREETVFAPWAPAEDDRPAASEYMDRVWTVVRLRGKSRRSLDVGNTNKPSF
jgi:cupin fold WbuC family metalloprotein